MNTRFRVVCCAVLTFLMTSAIAVASCKTGDTAFTQNYRGDTVNDVNVEFNDYGRIHVDANDPVCAEYALGALYNKVNNSLADADAFNRPLDGFLVALVFASAQRLGANGWASKDLDFLLRTQTGYPTTVESRYALEHLSPCNNEALDTCMDDYLGAASAHAWIAAYKVKRGADATANQNAAKSYLNQAFDAVCIHDPVAFPGTDKKTLCNGSAAGLRVRGLGGNSETMGVNHGYQKIPYGFGLMTSVASALLGLEVSGTSYTWRTYDKAIASALFEEAELHVDSGSNFEADCASPVRNTDQTWSFPSTKKCGGGNDLNGDGIVDEDEYKATMYALNEFYTDPTISITIPSVGTYRSTVFNDGNFQLAGTDNGFFSFGRYVTYGTHGYAWWATRPVWMPYDSNNPIGYFDGITTSGVAFGWSCDQDMPNGPVGGRIAVDLYDHFNNKVASTWANLSSESAVNSWCGGGTAHRFSVQLPTWTKNSTIRAYGLDYTWIGFTQLNNTHTW